MSDDAFLCVRCARHMKTCCQTSEVYTSPGDVVRIKDFTQRDDFTEFQAPVNDSYADQDDDPVWRDHVFRADGTRRILRRRDNGDCTFLGEHGCQLPLQVRPLVCRLYPFDYDSQGIRSELSPGCPLHLLAPDQGLVEALEMSPADARDWRRQLYEEIQLEASDT